MSLSRKFNAKSDAIFEYRIVMNEPVYSDNLDESRKAARDRADLFALLVNGWAIGHGSKQLKRFDAATPQNPQENAQDKTVRPVIKVFCTPDVMRDIQHSFSSRIATITRNGKWDAKGLKVSPHIWSHPRAKKTDDKSTPAAFNPEGYT